MSRTSSLPIDDVLGELVSAVSADGAAVLVAPPGAGKTTRVPPALLGDAPGRVVVVEPRRMAARAAARRVAYERGWSLGDEVGHHVRFDRRFGPRTRVLFCTEGMLLRRIQADPFLEGDTCIVFDEFHERSLDLDLALALVARLRSDVRSDLRVVVMSATLDPDPVAAFLGGAPVVHSEGRAHPVDVRFMPPERPRAGGGYQVQGGRGERLEDHVARGVDVALKESAGDVLVFLAGVGEIRRCEERLARRGDVDVVLLYGDLPPEKQDAALSPGARRRVVLSTNVAESSVTVGGVSAVVDSGEARVLRHDTASGLDRLAVERIDRAAADQRAGRAGRLGPGLCVRLWSAIDDRGLESFLVPEVRRLDLAGPVLQLAGQGDTDPDAFRWFERPRPEALRRARTLLERLEAIDDTGRITERGQGVLRLPLHPRLATLVLRAGRHGDLGSLAAALLSERDPFRVGGGRPTTADLYERCVDLEAFEAGERVDGLAPAGARNVLRVRDRIASAARKAGVVGKQIFDRDRALSVAALAAFPDRLCRRREDDPERAVMVGGRGVRVRQHGEVPELFVALDLLNARRPDEDDLVTLAIPVRREDVDGGRVRVSIEPRFDAGTERVVGRRREMLGELVLSESDHPANDPAEVERVLELAAREAPLRALGLDSGDAADVLERVRFLRAHRPELELPEPNEATLGDLVPMVVAGCRSFADLRKRPALDVFLGTFTHEQRVALDRDAPERIAVPSGSRIRLAYDGERAPVLAVKIQELFGLAETPRVAGGKVSVLLHLLAPNGRPQQVTDDLASFWSEAYHVVRKDLRGRYPKHPWPEDPTTAEATARTKRRR